MGGGDISSTRLKREECKRTKHDSVFSNWQILIGPSDWENHSSGKEGVERYRSHNLPISCSGPGLYELGIATCCSDTGREIRKLDPYYIIVVYLGEADNARTRLQEYGRDGSHLDHGNSVGFLDKNKGVYLQRGPGLFKEIFSRGFPIVFRWAAMESKEEAEKTEAQLLGIFDYAWNKGGNCARRPDDILIKLNKITSSTIQFPYIARKLQKWRWDNPFIQKQVGITIKGRTSTLNGTELNTYNYEGWNNLLRILKVSRSQPQLVTGKSSLNDGHTTICGVALGDGSVCRNKPIEGRKRCGSHRGKRINGSILKLMTDADPKVFGMGLQDGCTQEDPLHERKINSCDEEPEKHLSQHSKTYRSHPQMVVERCTTIEDHTTICGVVLSDGSVCRNQPSKGRKRCGQHKGKRINRITCKLSLEKKLHVRGTGLENESVCMEVPVLGRSINSCRDLKHDELISGTSNFEKSQPQSVAGTCVSEKCTAVCEMALGDGSVCRNEAVEGRRCAQHKGMMSNRSHVEIVLEKKLHVCGVGLEDGSVCKEVPKHGRKRCELHKGRKVITHSHSLKNN